MTAVTCYESFGEPPSTPVCLHDSTGAVCTSRDPGQLLSFLRYTHSGVLRVVWDLDEFVAPVLKTLPLSVLESLSRFSDDCQYGSHQLYYLPDRMFRVGRSRFYGIRGFWSSDYPEPSSLVELQERADDLMSTLEVCGMADPSKLTSPIAVWGATELGREAYDSIPKGYELPKNVWEALSYAYQCDRREWISAYQVGHFDRCFDYDLSSAYPSVAAELLDLRDMDFWKSTVYGRRERSAHYGFVRGHLYLDPSASCVHCSPIMVDLERMPGNPAGDFGHGYYQTLDELRFIENNDLGKFDMVDGWFIAPRSGVQPGRPFQRIMNFLYNQRFHSDLAASVMKAIANQTIGKLIETRVDGDYGDLRNDIYHALILARTRVKVAGFLIQNDVLPSELVAVQTDGVRLTRHIPLSGSGMGLWRCNGAIPTIVASPYKVYAGDKKPGHLTYDHVTSMVAARPGASYYGRTVKHRITLKQAIQQGDISLVGVLDDLPAHLDLNSIPREQNCLFKRLPHSGHQLLSRTYQSTPVVI